MNADTVQLVLDAGSVVLKFLGGISLVGAMAFVTAYYAFPPNLTVEEVKDKGKHNFESRLIIRNIGKLPAYNVVVDVKNMNFRMGDIHMQNMNTENCGVSTKVLAVSEKMEIPACPHVGVPLGSSLQSCDYTLLIKYELRLPLLPFYKQQREKCWYIELRNSGSDFTWQMALR
jgi:hypothetical protein